jgi:hypothetical protein
MTCQTGAIFDVPCNLIGKQAKSQIKPFKVTGKTLNKQSYIIIMFRCQTKKKSLKNEMYKPQLKYLTFHLLISCILHLQLILSGVSPVRCQSASPTL